MVYPTDNTCPCLYLIPNFIGFEKWEYNFPEFNKNVICALKHFIAEDIRSCRKLLKAAGYPDIGGAIVEEYNEHHFNKNIEHLLNPIKDGYSIGLVTDAGVPAIADPGDVIVRLAHQKNIKVVPLIGPSAVMLAIMSAGLCGNNFAFNGYLPIETHQKIKKIKELEQLSFTKQQAQFFIETPYRNQKLFSLLLQILHPNTYLSIASNLLHAEGFVKTMTVQDWKNSNLPDIHKKPCIFGIFKSSLMNEHLL